MWVSADSVNNLAPQLLCGVFGIYELIINMFIYFKAIGI